MKERIKYLDHLKCLAIIVMLYGHLVGAGTFEHNIVPVVKFPLEETLIPFGTHALGGLDTLLHTVHTSSARGLGTTLFFIVSGYLGARSRKNKGTLNYAVDKIIRIWSAFIPCVLVYTLFLGISQDYWFKLPNELATLTLTYRMFDIEATTGVVWFLAVVVTFYIVLLPFKNISKENIYTLYAVALLLMITSNYYAGNKILKIYAFDMKYVCFMLTGSMLYVCERDKDNIGTFLTNVLTSIGLTLVCMRGNMLLNGDPTLDYTVGTFVVTYTIYAVYYLIELKRPNILNFGSKAAEFISNMAMPIYLLHVPLGLGGMYLVKYKFHLRNSYLILLCGVILSLLSAFLIHKFVEVPVQKFLSKKWAKLGYK